MRFCPDASAYEISEASRPSLDAFLVFFAAKMKPCHPLPPKPGGKIKSLENPSSSAASSPPSPGLQGSWSFRRQFGDTWGGSRLCFRVLPLKPLGWEKSTRQNTGVGPCQRHGFPPPFKLLSEPLRLSRPFRGPQGRQFALMEPSNPSTETLNPQSRWQEVVSPGRVGQPNSATPSLLQKGDAAGLGGGCLRLEAFLDLGDVWGSIYRSQAERVQLTKGCSVQVL